MHLLKEWDELLHNFQHNRLQPLRSIQTADHPHSLEEDPIFYDSKDLLEGGDPNCFAPKSRSAQRISQFINTLGQLSYSRLKRSYKDKVVTYQRFSVVYSHLQRIANVTGLKLNWETSPGCVVASPPIYDFAVLQAECYALLIRLTSVQKCQSNNASELAHTSLDSENILIKAVQFAYNNDRAQLAPSCDEVVDQLNMGNWSALLRHIDGLDAMYDIEGEKSSRCRAYLCLQSLERDLYLLTSVSPIQENGTAALHKYEDFLLPSTSSQLDPILLNVLNQVRRGPLGILLPRIGGIGARLLYFLNPQSLMPNQQALDDKQHFLRLEESTTSVSEITSASKLYELQAGQWIRFSLLSSKKLHTTGSGAGQAQAVEPLEKHHLHFIPLVTIQKDANGICRPQFAKHGNDHVKSIPVAATFVMLFEPKPLILVATHIDQLAAISELFAKSVSGSSPAGSAASSSSSSSSYANILSLYTHSMDADYRTNMSGSMAHLSLRGQSFNQDYEIHCQLVGKSMEHIPFNHPDQLLPMIALLRKQAAFNNIFELIFAAKPIIWKEPELHAYVEIHVINLECIHLLVNHPTAMFPKLTFIVSINEWGIYKCKLSTACDELADAFVDKLIPSILEECENLLIRFQSIPLFVDSFCQQFIHIQCNLMNENSPTDSSMMEVAAKALVLTPMKISQSHSSASLARPIVKSSVRSFSQQPLPGASMIVIEKPSLGFSIARDYDFNPPPRRIPLYVTHKSTNRRIALPFIPSAATAAGAYHHGMHSMMIPGAGGGPLLPTVSSASSAMSHAFGGGGGGGGGNNNASLIQAQLYTPSRLDELLGSDGSSTNPLMLDSTIRDLIMPQPSDSRYMVSSNSGGATLSSTGGPLPGVGGGSSGSMSSSVLSSLLNDESSPSAGSLLAGSHHATSQSNLRLHSLAVMTQQSNVVLPPSGGLQSSCVLPGCYVPLSSAAAPPGHSPLPGVMCKPNLNTSPATPVPLPPPQSVTSHLGTGRAGAYATGSGNSTSRKRPPPPSGPGMGPHGSMELADNSAVPVQKFLKRSPSEDFKGMLNSNSTSTTSGANSHFGVTSSNELRFSASSAASSSSSLLLSKCDSVYDFDEPNTLPPVSMQSPLNDLMMASQMSRGQKGPLKLKIKTKGVSSSCTPSGGGDSNPASGSQMACLSAPAAAASKRPPVIPVGAGGGDMMNYHPPSSSSSASSSYYHHPTAAGAAITTTSGSGNPTTTGQKRPRKRHSEKTFTLEEYAKSTGQSESDALIEYSNKLKKDGSLKKKPGRKRKPPNTPSSSIGNTGSNSGSQPLVASGGGTHGFSQPLLPHFTSAAMHIPGIAATCMTSNSTNFAGLSSSATTPLLASAQTATLSASSSSSALLTPSSINVNASPLMNSSAAAVAETAASSGGMMLPLTSTALSGMGSIDQDLIMASSSSASKVTQPAYPALNKSPSIPKKKRDRTSAGSQNRRSEGKASSNQNSKSLNSLIGIDLFDVSKSTDSAAMGKYKIPKKKSIDQRISPNEKEASSTSTAAAISAADMALTAAISSVFHDAAAPPLVGSKDTDYQVSTSNKYQSMATAEKNTIQLDMGSSSLSGGGMNVPMSGAAGGLIDSSGSNHSQQSLQFGMLLNLKANSQQNVQQNPGKKKSIGAIADALLARSSNVNKKESNSSQKFVDSGSAGVGGSAASGGANVEFSSVNQTNHDSDPPSKKKEDNIFEKLVSSGSTPTKSLMKSVSSTSVISSSPSLLVGLCGDRLMGSKNDPSMATSVSGAGSVKSSHNNSSDTVSKHLDDTFESVLDTNSSLVSNLRTSTALSTSEYTLMRALKDTPDSPPPADGSSNSFSSAPSIIPTMGPSTAVVGAYGASTTTGLVGNKSSSSSGSSLFPDPVGSASQSGKGSAGNISNPHRPSSAQGRGVYRGGSSNFRSRPAFGTVGHRFRSPSTTGSSSSSSGVAHRQQRPPTVRNSPNSSGNAESNSSAMGFDNFRQNRPASGHASGNSNFYRNSANGSGNGNNNASQWRFSSNGSRMPPPNSRGPSPY